MSIDLSPVLRRPRAFLGISFDEADRKLRDWFEKMLGVCGFEPVTAEASEHKALGEKVRAKIKSCDVSCFVLSPRDKIDESNEWRCPEWIPSEIGMAYGEGKKFAVFVEKNVTVKGLVMYVEDYTSFDRVSLNSDIPQITNSLLSLRLPTLHDALTLLLTENQLAPLQVLLALKRMILLTRQINGMREKIPESSVVAIVRDVNPIMVIDKGTKHGVIESSSWRIFFPKSRDPKIEVEVGRAIVCYAQLDMAQLGFIDSESVKKLTDVIGDFHPDGKTTALTGWLAKPEEPRFLANAAQVDLDRFISFLDELLERVVVAEV